MGDGPPDWLSSTRQDMNVARKEIYHMLLDRELRPDKQALIRREAAAREKHARSEVG